MPTPKTPATASSKSSFATTKKSEFFQKMGAKVASAHNKHKGEDTKLESAAMGLPGGIENGVAQLIEMKLEKIKEGKTNAGQYYFSATGIVVEPEYVGRIKVRGKRTTIMENMFDTPNASARKTFDDHYAHVLTILRTFGVDTEAMKGEDFENTLKELGEAGYFFSFRTWKPKKRAKGERGYNEKYDGPDAPEPRVQELWGEMLTDFNPGDVESNAQAEVEDETEAEPEPEAEAAEIADEEAAADEAEEAAGDEGTEAEATEFTELEDLDTLVISAMEGDVDAGNKLTDLAVAAGVEQADVESAADWNAVADLIKAAGGESAEGEAAEEEPEAFVPKKGGMFKYQILDPKTKKPVIDPKTKKAKKPIDVEVVAVNTKANTVDLKNVDDGKTIYKGVSFDKLIQE